MSGGGPGRRHRKTEERNVQFLLRNFAGGDDWEPTPERILHQRRRLRRDLQTKKQRRGTTIGPIVKPLRKGIPTRKEPFTEFSVHISKQSVDALVEQFLPEEPDSKPPAQETFTIQVQWMDASGSHRVLEEHPLTVQPNTTIQHILTQFAMDLDDDEIQWNDLEASFQCKTLAPQDKVGQTKLQQGSVLTVKKVQITTSTSIVKNLKVPARKVRVVDPFAESSDEDA